MSRAGLAQAVADPEPRSTGDDARDSRRPGREERAMPQQPILHVHDGGDRDEVLRRRRGAWTLVRDAYMEAASALDPDDEDRVLMLDQGRRAAAIAGLPWRAVRAVPQADRDRRYLAG